MACTIPDLKQGTIAEYNGEIVNAGNNDNNALTTNNNFPLYSSIKFEKIDSETPHFIGVLDFLEDYAYNKIVDYAWSKLQEGLDMLQKYENFNRAKQLYDNLNKTPKIGLSRDVVIHNQGLFKSISWHPHQEILAVATNTDDVYIYTKKGESKWICQVLSHKRMKNIRCIQWKTKALGTLAVGCQVGVCVWTIDNNVNYSEGTRYHPSASAKYFEHHEGVTALAWDPSPGSQLLAVASLTTGEIAIQDIVLNRTVHLKRQGKGNNLLRWSQDGKWLFVGGLSGKSRVWDTDNWKSRQLKNPPGLWVQAACWLHDNMTLLYSMKGKNDIHALCLSESSLDKGIWDVKLKSASVMGSKGSSVVRDICIDNRHGQRIVVAFENSSILGLYNVQISPLNLRERTVFTPIGYLRGAQVEYEANGTPKITALREDARPLHVSFSSSYKCGAILATAWDNGTITFVTHTFKSVRDFDSNFI